MGESQGRITLPAYAKLNLALAVGPALPPRGYHPIASWFVAIEFHDDMVVGRLDAGAPSRHTIQWASDAPRPTPIDWPIEKDLAVRAHRLLEHHAGRPLPVELEVRKRVPVGGGLGGGSSDAAAALIGIDRAHELRLGAPALRGLAAELGSDVAFFLDEPVVESGVAAPRPALVTGLGERIERVAGPRCRVLLFIPPFGCPTGPVYQAFDRAPNERLDEARVRGLIAGCRDRESPDPHALFNDLASPACRVEPRLAEVWGELRRAAGHGVTVHVTGSGSTLFALVGVDNERQVHGACRTACPGVQIVGTSILAP